MVSWCFSDIPWLEPVDEVSSESRKQVASFLPQEKHGRCLSQGQKTTMKDNK